MKYYCSRTKSLLLLGKREAKECIMNLKVSFGVNFAKAFIHLRCADSSDQSFN